MILTISDTHDPETGPCKFPIDDKLKERKPYIWTFCLHVSEETATCNTLWLSDNFS